MTNHLFAFFAEPFLDTENGVVVVVGEELDLAFGT
jgi:hypothetical protein